MAEVLAAKGQIEYLKGNASLKNILKARSSVLDSR
jgi:hypothetical protein